MEKHPAADIVFLRIILFVLTTLAAGAGAMTLSLAKIYDPGVLEVLTSAESDPRGAR